MIMKEYSDEELLMLSGIHHFAFCKRRWALVHLENQWADNVKTVEGNILHEHCHDTDFTESRGDLLIVRGLYFSSYKLGVTGQCDVVEFTRCDDGKGAVLFGREGTWDICPVEYKKGRPISGLTDISQLCGQALCLEEMFGCRIEYGYLYYGEPRKRQKVIFTDELRTQVKDMLKEMHEYYKRSYTPKVKTTPKCKSCSLKDICLPKLCKNISVAAYYSKNLGADEK